MQQKPRVQGDPSTLPPPSQPAWAITEPSTPVSPPMEDRQHESDCYEDQSEENDTDSDIF